MYNPYEEFEGSDAPLSESVINRADAHIQQSEVTQKALEEAEQVDPTGKVGPPNPAQPQQAPQQQAEGQQPQQQEQQKEVNPENQTPYDAGDYARTVAEGAMAAPVALTDFGVDLVNKIPGVNIPKVPKFKNDLTQAARELTSIIAPTIILTRLGKGGGTKLAGKYPTKFARSEFGKWFGETSVGAGAGAFVDAVVETNTKDDNLQGSLKKMFPKHMSWISDDWATLDSDAPDVKRAKNVNEGIGLGIFTDLLLGGVKLLRAAQKMATSHWIPESETAKAYFKNLQDAEAQKAASTVEEEVLANAELREIAKDELGEYRIEKNPNLDEPMMGVHDVFDIEEEGIRSVDAGGVIGATVDQARIRGNRGTTWGRLGSIISEAALKYGLKADNLTKRQIINAVAWNIKNAGEYSYRYAGGKIPFKEIDDAGTELASVLLDPKMEPGMLKATLDNYMDTIRGTRTLDDVGYNGAFKAIKGYLDEYLNMDTLKAQAYLRTSLAGQVSDLAEGARIMDGTAAIERAQEQILDRLEYLVVEKGLNSYLKGSALNYLNLWKRLSYMNDPAALQDAAEKAKIAAEGTMNDVVPKAKKMIDTIRTISKERPEYLRPFSMAYEFTDGKVDTMDKLNNFAQASLGDLHKFFLDGQPEVPNVIVQGMWANIYNSVLTSVSTPMKALWGNSAMLLEKPVSVIAGAAVSLDIKTMRRAWFQYSALGDSLQKGLAHMSLVYKKAATDPTSVGYIMRDDIVLKNEQTMETLRSYAEAAMKDGNDGPMVLYQQAEALNDLANNPWLRFGANAMTALDGFARAMIANAEARGRIYDKFFDGTRALDGDELRKLNDEVYNSMFDSNGMITDEAVDYASREIALNLDNPAVNYLNGFIQQVPAVKPFLMFPRTSANMIAMANKHSPISLFANEYNKLAMPFQKFSGEEIIEILQSKGLPTDGDVMATFNTLRAEVRGRKAIGTLTMMSASYMFLNGNLRGNGHYDKERQRVRRELGWKPRSYRGWDGKWYSYDGLGAISDFLALTADVMDNFDSVTPNDLETNINKLGFLLSANLTSRSVLAGLEPMNDVLAGNPAALNRWAASFSSSLMPLSGARNELGRLLAPPLRELDMEFTQNMRNRNKFLDVVDKKGALPYKYDWLDGTLVGYDENFFVRAWNAVMPMKVSDGMSPERQFLLDIEYDTRPSFNKSTKSVEYTPDERSELYSILGKQGIFKKAVQEIMDTRPAKEWRKQIKEQRATGAQVDPNLWQDLYGELDRALESAKKIAETELSNYDEVMQRQYEQGVDKQLQKQGETFLQWKNY